MNIDDGTVTGFIDMPPYVTIVAPGATAFARAAEDAPPTQFKASFGLGRPEAATSQQQPVRAGSLTFCNSPGELPFLGLLNMPQSHSSEQAWPGQTRGSYIMQTAVTERCVI